MAPAAGVWSRLGLVVLIAGLGDALLPPLPMSGAETFNRAAKSIAAASAAGRRRQLVKIVIPLPPETKEEDIGSDWAPRIIRRPLQQATTHRPTDPSHRPNRPLARGSQPDVYRGKARGEGHAREGDRQVAPIFFSRF